jgi:rare lipoprotein A (peptidoglycan hydrolase)
MIAQPVAVTRRPRASFPAPRGGIRPAAASLLPAITLDPTRHANVISALSVAAGVFACAAATLATISYQDGKRGIGTSTPVLNELIVFRQEELQTHSEQMAVSGGWQASADAALSHYPRVVRTVRFINPNTTQNLGTLGEELLKPKPNIMNGRRGVSTEYTAYRAEGIASWYGPDFHGRRTANGERYDMNGISAAHRTMPLPSYARVTNLENGRSIIVRINNRGPFVRNRIVDLSIGTAKALDFYRKGTAHVRVEFVGRAPAEGADDQVLLATLREGTPAPAPSKVMVASAKPFLAKKTDGKEPRSATEH